MPHFIFDFVVSLGCRDVREVFFECANIRIDGHAVVIQDDKQVGIFSTTVVQPLESQPRSHGTITDDGHVFFVFAPIQFAGDSHSQRSRDGG